MIPFSVFVAITLMLFPSYFHLLGKFVLFEPLLKNIGY